MMKKENCVAWIQTVSLYIKKHDIYNDIAEDGETRFENSNNELDRTVPKRKK